MTLQCTDRAIAVKSIVCILVPITISVTAIFQMQVFHELFLDNHMSESIHTYEGLSRSFWTNVKKLTISLDSSENL